MCELCWAHHLLAIVAGQAILEKWRRSECQKGRSDFMAADLDTLLQLFLRERMVTPG
jgi:hypothetical protein